MVHSKKKRTTGIFLFVILVIGCAAWNGLRLGWAFFFWNTLKAYGANPVYISLSGGLWLVVGLVLTWSLWQGKSWGRVMVICSAFGYTIWYWLDRFFLQKPHTNWPFALIANILFLIGIFVTLSTKRTKNYFERNV